MKCSEQKGGSCKHRGCRAGRHLWKGNKPECLEPCELERAQHEIAKVSGLQKAQSNHLAVQQCRDFLLMGQEARGRF
jgi:hypothetical protein